MPLKHIDLAVTVQDRYHSRKWKTRDACLMMSLPNMLLIGSAGRDAGKTEFAAALIGHLAPRTGLIGVKATVIRRNDGSCPRGGRGCGVCSSLRGPYEITAETSCDSGKDTSRLLAAGAERVFWLRVRQDSMAEGVRALLDTAGREALLVCESNSLRHAVKPGLFIMVRRINQPFKQSAAAVRCWADRIVTSDGERFDLDIDTIRPGGGRWALMEDAAAIVLAGGRSGRMKQDKSLLRIGGQTMIERVCGQLRNDFRDVLVVADAAEKYSFLGLRVVRDRIQGCGPLMGIATGLEESPRDLNLVVACDMPELDISLAHRMLGLARDRDIVVPRSADGLPEPLFAVYRKSVAAQADHLLASGERRIRPLFDHCRTGYVDLEDGQEVLNLNTREDLAAYVGATVDII